MGQAFLSCGLLLQKQHSNHFEHFPLKKKKLAMQNHENTHQYPMYPFPDGWVSGPSGALAFEGELLVFAGGIATTCPTLQKYLFAFFHIISIIHI